MMPKILYRIDDGERFIRKGDSDIFCMERCMMVPPYEYSFDLLMSTSCFTANESEIQLKKHECRTEGCGYDD